MLLSAAWHGEAFQRMKTMPEHEALMGETKQGDAKAMTPEEQAEYVRNWARRWGGDAVTIH